MSDLRAAKGAVSLRDGSGATPQSLGFTPQALLLWWTCQERDGVAAGNRGGVGFAAAGSGGGAIAWVSKDGSPTARTASWADDVPVAGLADGEPEMPALRAEVDFGEGGFSLRVIRAEAAWRVHYLAVGGADVRAEARWVSAQGGPGEQRVALGLRPDLLLLASAALPARGAVARGLSITLGASSGPGAQVSAACASPDGAAPGSVAGAQRADAAIVSVTTGAELDALARVRERDEHGFTLHWERGSSVPRQVLCLALAGTRCKVAAWSSPVRPGRRTIRGMRLQPRAFVCFSWGLGASAAASHIGRLSLGGATSHASQGAVCWDDRNTAESATATHVHSSSEDVLLVSDTRTGALHAAATVASFNRRRVTLEWSRSDGSVREFLYVALGARGGALGGWAGRLPFARRLLGRVGSRLRR